MGEVQWGGLGVHRKVNTKQKPDPLITILLPIVQVVEDLKTLTEEKKQARMVEG